MTIFVAEVSVQYTREYKVLIEREGTCDGYLIAEEGLTPVELERFLKNVVPPDMCFAPAYEASIDIVHVSLPDPGEEWVEL